MRAIQFHNHLAFRLPFVGTISVRIIVDCLICPLRIKAVMLANQKPEAARAREARDACGNKSHRKLACFCNQPTGKDRASNSSQVSAGILQSCPTPGCFRPG